MKPSLLNIFALSLLLAAVGLVGSMAAAEDQPAAPAAPVAQPTLDDPLPAKQADGKQLAAEQPKAAEQPAPAGEPAAAGEAAPAAEQPKPAEPPPAAPQGEPAEQPQPVEGPQEPIVLPQQAPETAEAAPGDRFTMNVKDIELVELLQMIGAKYRVSIICSSEVAGSVSVNFYDVTLEEALDAILTVNNLTFTRRGKVIHIHKPVAAAPPQAVPAVKKVAKSFDLGWTDSATVLKVLNDLKMGTGTVAKAEGGRDVVLAYDDPEVVDRIGEVVASLDRKPRQVLITTWVMELSDTDIRNLGMNWTSLDSMKVFEYSGEVSKKKGRIEDSPGVTHGFHESLTTSVDLRAGILSDNQFNLLLSFFDTLSKSKVVAEPRVMTQENKPANIVVGTLVPIPLFDFAKESGTRILSGFQDQQVGTQVTVTARVQKDGFISLEISPKVQAIIDYIVVNGEKQRPIVSTREAKTTVMVKSGDTVVIGGLRDESRTIQGSQVPFLGSIPILGWLFKNRTENNHVTDLTIFIRPELFDEENPLSLEEKTVFESHKPVSLVEPAKDEKKK